MTLDGVEGNTELGNLARMGEAIIREYQLQYLDTKRSKFRDLYSEILVINGLIGFISGYMSMPIVYKTIVIQIIGWKTIKLKRHLRWSRLLGMRSCSVTPRAQRRRRLPLEQHPVSRRGTTIRSDREPTTLHNEYQRFRRH